MKIESLALGYKAVFVQKFKCFTNAPPRWVLEPHAPLRRRAPSGQGLHRQQSTHIILLHPRARLEIESGRVGGRMWGLSDGADGKGAPRGCSLNGPRTRACVSASLCRLFPRGRLAASPPPPRHRRLRPRGPHPAPTWLSSSPPSLAARQRTRRGHRSFPRDHHAGRGAPEPRLYLPRRRRGGRRAAARAPQGQSLSHRSRCPSPVREGGVGSGAPATFALRAARAATRPARRTRAATRSRTPATSTRPLLRRPGSGSLPGRRSRRRRSRRRRSGTRRLARRSRSTRRPTQSPARSRRGGRCARRLRSSTPPASRSPSQRTRPPRSRPASRSRCPASRPRARGPRSPACRTGRSAATRSAESRSRTSPACRTRRLRRAGRRRQGRAGACRPRGLARRRRRRFRRRGGPRGGRGEGAQR
mmetsp:Transcript_20151/g.59678  ORF Transcript_20151/g.59678 Transcript_20151/m.59678 type:complete len:418 (-) Transcript_20151:2433-3686(-)